MKRNTTIRIIILFSLLFSLTNCETVLDNVIDCAVGRKPNLISKELNSGMILQLYNENVTFEMINAKTNDYSISETLIKGSLPPNINYNTLNNKINFSGVPNKKGTYEFTITITVHPNQYNSDGTDNLCESSSTKDYKIIIN